MQLPPPSHWIRTDQGICPSDPVEENGEKKIEIDWSELSADDEADIIQVIENHYDYINECIDKVFNGEKVDILRINKKQ